MVQKEKRTGIKDYQRIRRYLGGIYLYGFLKRKDFASRNDGSAQNYSFMIHLIQALLSLEQDAEQKRDSHRIRRKYHLSGNCCGVENMGEHIFYNHFGIIKCFQKGSSDS